MSQLEAKIRETIVKHGYLATPEVLLLMEEERNNWRFEGWKMCVEAIKRDKETLKDFWEYVDSDPKGDK